MSPDSKAALEKYLVHCERENDDLKERITSTMDDLHSLMDRRSALITKIDALRKDLA